MHTGSCLCGAVSYTYQGEINEISRCYCSQCQKGQGGAFVAVAPIETDLFAFVSGENALREFRATPSKRRVFCSICASPIFSARDDIPEMLRLRVGTLDTEIAPNKQYHAFVASKANWYAIDDDFPQYRELPTD